MDYPELEEEDLQMPMAAEEWKACITYTDNWLSVGYAGFSYTKSYTRLLQKLHWEMHQKLLFAETEVVAADAVLWTVGDVLAMEHTTELAQGGDVAFHEHVT